MKIRSRTCSVPQILSGELRQSGSSMMSVIVAAGLAGIVGLGIARMSSHGIQAAKSTSDRQDLSSVKKTILENLDCQATLGLTTFPTTPLSCSSYSSVVLRRGNGDSLVDTSGQLGPWTIEARCTNNEIIISALRSGKDMLTGKPWTSLPQAIDLFSGTSEFCRAFFDGTVAPKWELAGGYTTNYYDCKGMTVPKNSANLSCCRYANPLTGGCDCPSGFSPYQSDDFDNFQCASGRYADGWRSKGCGILRFLCVRVN